MSTFSDTPLSFTPTTGDTGKIQAFLRVLEPYGIKEIAQSGLLAIGRGSKSITERVFKN